MEMEQQVEKILSVVVDNQSKLGGLDARIARLENAQTGTFDKLDQFIGLMKHQNTELAALGSRYQRLEERIMVLESR